jgi:hypothetical protein
MKQFFKLLLALSLMATTPVFAQSQNTVYIDQIGSNSAIDVTQTGSNNVMGDETTKAIFRGNSQLVMITQIGSNNNSVFNIQGNGAQLTSNVTGSFNTVNASCGAAPTTACTDTVITANITGSTNNVNITAGAKSLATVDATGDNNTVGITSSTTNLLGARARVTSTGGNGNAITVSQTGTAGLNGFDATIDVTGGTNTIGVTQSGTVDSTVNIKSVGSNNTITVRSGN